MMKIVVLCTSIGLLTIIALGDMRMRRIPNVLSFIIAILGLARMILDLDLIAALHTIEASAAVFAVAFLLFSLGMLGGGDAKLIAATALLIGYHDLVDFLFLMSVCGGVLALAVLVRDKFRQQRSYCSRSTGGTPAQTTEGILSPMQSTVPYGVAIAGAAVLILVLKTSYAP
jgi:prepilin peptidase CpaA